MEEKGHVFKKLDRSYCTPPGSRLATFQEAKDNLERIKEQGVLKDWEIARLLDGWISGPSYEFQMDNNFRACMGYMIVIEMDTGTSGSLYADVDLGDSAKEVALFLCLEDWNYEVVYWLLNSWAKPETETMDPKDLNIQLSSVPKFKEMNMMISSLARKLGDVEPASMNAAKKKYSGADSVKEVLSRKMVCVKEEEQRIQQLMDDDELELHFEEIIKLAEKQFARLPVEPAWLGEVASDVGWEGVADAFWNFLSDSYSALVIEICAILGVAQIYKLSKRTTHKNFMLAGSILYYLSINVCAIIHAPVPPSGDENCLKKIICYAAQNKKGDPEGFNQMLQNNAMCRCYEKNENYDLRNKLLVLAARGTDGNKLHTEKKDDVMVVKCLLEYGAQPLTALASCKMKTALHYAAKLEDEDEGLVVAESLLDKCDGKQRNDFVSAADVKGRTALHRASSLGHTSICELLLKNGARLDAKDEDGQTPLHYAVDRMENEVINLFMESQQITKCVDLKDKEENSPLDIALGQTKKNDGIELVAKLLTKSKCPEAYFNKLDGEQHLSRSLLKGYGNIVQQLLRESLVKGYIDIVKKLFENEAKLPYGDGDGDDEGKTALHLAAMCEDENKAQHMVEIIFTKTPEKKKLVVKCDRRGRTVLHEAALKGHYWLSKHFLEINSKIINIRDGDGRNPLYDAVKGKHDDVVLLKMLLEPYFKNGMSPNDLIDRTGLTPLHLAVSEGKRQLAKVLLHRNQFKLKYLKRADFLGQTALHKAAKCGDSDIVKLLLENGANPYEERDCDGRTALHYAVQAKTGEEGKNFAKLFLDKCGSNENKLLFLWASAAGIGTAEQNLNDLELRKFLLLQRKNIAKEVGTDNLLKIAALTGNIEMAKELLSRGYEIADIQDPDWRDTLTDTQKNNARTVSKQIERIAEQGNDLPTISDLLGRLDYAQGLAALFLNSYLKPPIVVGISGSWGMGKSSLMMQTESILLKTKAQLSLLPPPSTSTLPGVKSIKLSKAGEKKYKEIKRRVDFLKRDQKVNNNLFVTIMHKFIRRAKKSDKEESSTNHGHDDEDSLPKFLNIYEAKYHDIFKSLAVMDSRDMFTINTQESKPEGSVPAILTVRYNAWRYRNETEALAGMAVEITKEMEGIMTKDQWLSTCWRNTWRKQKQTIFIDIIFPCLLVVLLACSFTWIVWMIMDTYKIKEWAKAKYACLPAAIIIIVWILVKSLMGILKPVSSQLMHLISFPDHEEKLGYQERVISDITFLKDEIGKKPYFVFTVFIVLWRLVTEVVKWWIESLFSNPKYFRETMVFPKGIPAPDANLRVVCFVDDLDRCQESVILQVLSAINLVLAVCEINVVLGMDKEMVQRAIIKKYGYTKSKSLKSSQELADKYLQKIIQLPLDLPDPSESQSKKFLQGQLGVFPKESKETDSESATGHIDKILSLRAMPDVITPRESISRRARAEDSADREVAIVVQSETPTEINASASRETSPPVQTESRADAETDAERVITSDAETTNSIHNENCISSIHIREMLFVRYSEGERDAFCYFQRLATDCRKLPREWKRLLTYHRLVWNIFSVSNEAKVVTGWQVQLITWIFVCWEWQENMNILIEKWNNIGLLKTRPSLLMLLEHLIKDEGNKKNMTAEEEEVSKHFIKEDEGNKKKMTAGRQEGDIVKIIEQPENKERRSEKSEEEKKKKEEEVSSRVPEGGVAKNIDGLECSNNATENLDDAEETLRLELEELKKDIKDLKDLVVKQLSGKNEKTVEEKGTKIQNWQKMRSALRTYDVTMDAIQAFQRFRFYCIAGHLPWPLPNRENGET